MHTFELHIWGPAFGLPSLHAECIAAVAFLRQVLQPEDWVAIPSHDTSSSPSKDFPLLRHGDEWICGFHGIVDYLCELHSLRPIDVNLSPEQRADRSAFSTFISTSAQPLIDLSLYVSIINYRSSIQPAYTALLPWHLNYTIPPQHRAAARARTQHLGITVLDAGTVHGDTDGAADSQSGGQGHPQPNGVISAGRQSRPGPFSKQTILAMVQGPQHAGWFRLESLVTAFLEPLQEYLGDKRYLLGDEGPTSLDSLALGYLGLMLYPEVPMDSLRQIMRSKFGKVCRYVERMRGELFGEEKFVVEDIMASTRLETPRNIQSEREKLGMRVPWQSPHARTPGLADILATLGKQLATRIPGLPRVTIKHITSERLEDVQTAQRTPIHKANDYLAVLGLTGGVLAFVGYLAYQRFTGSSPKLQSFYSSRPTKLSDLGEAGAALAVLSQQLEYGAVGGSRRGMQGREEPVAELDVGVGVSGDPLV